MSERIRCPRRSRLRKEQVEHMKHITAIDTVSRLFRSRARLVKRENNYLAFGLGTEHL